MKKIFLIILFTFSFQLLVSQKISEPFKGWCVYTYEASSEKHLEMLRTCKPTVIRWFMEWDRVDIIKNGISLRERKLKAFKPFFEICAQQKITLIIQIWVKEGMWTGDEEGGVSWAKPDKFSNYPKNITDSYGNFVNELIQLMISCGIPKNQIILEAWNEADLLWGVKEKTPNYHEPWKLFTKKGFSKWTGGSGEKWKLLHQVLKNHLSDIRWANSSVGILERYKSWIKPTYQIPEISILDFHYYLWNSQSARQYCDSIAQILERWDKELPPGKIPYPFFIGECARYSKGSTTQLTLSTQDAQMMREIYLILKEKYPNRFMGMIAHGPISMWQKGYAWYHENYSP